ncbi:unnamed protein product [Candida verbasci]|uniref:ATP-dependent RNA helicase n=1 Tax=Candida verbasci TaxID=1227364 RepID=A0A9W4U2C2_9ASCO|nr:unnamed protein product [Candida verbasci]
MFSLLRQPYDTIIRCDYIRLIHNGRKLVKKQGSKRVDRKRNSTSGSSSNLIFESGKFSKLYNKPVKQDFIQDKIDNFNQLKIFPSVRDAMIKEIKSQYNNTANKPIEEIEIKPSPVQISSIRKITQSRKLKPIDSDSSDSKKSILDDIKLQNELSRTKVFTIAAETGSGKTWAYLSSLLTKLKFDDLELYSANRLKFNNDKKDKYVRSIILLPTHELIDQVYNVLQRANETELNNMDGIAAGYKSFIQNEDGNKLNLHIAKLAHGDPPIDLFTKLDKLGRIDILVTTPGKITGFSKLSKIESPFKPFKKLKYCILDEADTLFDKSFKDETVSVITNFPNLLDLILVSATIPKEFEKTIKSLFPDYKSLIRIETPSLHKVPKGIKIMTLDADLPPYNGSVNRCLAQCIYAISKDGTEPNLVKRIIIFVNEKEETEILKLTLIEKFKIRAQDIVAINGRVKISDRKELIEPFIKPAMPIDEDPDGSKVKILITSDLLARGLNFIGIKNVILMGIPRNSVDLVHRLGRTGRMNQSGRVFIIVSKKKSKKHFVKGLNTAILRGFRIG